MTRKRKHQSNNNDDNDNDNNNSKEIEEYNNKDDNEVNEVNKDNKDKMINNNENVVNYFSADIPNEINNDIISYVLTVGEEINGIDSNNDYEDKDNFEQIGSKKDLMLKNVWSEIQGCEAGISCHKAGSKVIESIIRSNHSLTRMTLFLESIRKNFGFMAYDAFGSHVLETFFHTSAYILYKSNDISNEEQIDSSNNNDDFINEKEAFENLIVKLCGELNKVGKFGQNINVILFNIKL